MDTDTLNKHGLSKDEYTQILNTGRVDITSSVFFQPCGMNTAHINHQKNGYGFFLQKDHK